MIMMDQFKHMTQAKEVLSLYRHFLRMGRILTHSDKEYYLRRVREEFRKNQNLTQENEIQRCIDRAHTFLRNGRLM
ncbi:mitochondrial ribosome and complex I assembly factor AltMIEF1-like isoform X2 [Crassostrea virginica]